MGAHTRLPFQERLASEIRAYWARRGHTVTVEVVKDDKDNCWETQKIGALYVIQSDLVNGLPQGWKP